MKEFDNNNMNNENMNPELNRNENEENMRDGRPEADFAENNNTEQTTETQNTESSYQQTDHQSSEGAQSPNTGAGNTANTENPYFQGYSRPSEPYQYNRPLNDQAQNNQPQNSQQYNQPQNTQPNYQQNQGNGNPYWREYPYRNDNQPHQNNQQYNQQQNNQQNGYYGHQYSQNGGQISYTPSRSAKNKKEKKSAYTGVIAAACALTLVFSAAFGFGGAMLANHLNAGSENGANSEVKQTSGVESPVVIYRNVEDVATSAGNSGENLTYSQVAAMVKDSVVEIVTEFNNQSIWYQYVTQGAGSGVIISTDGYIITNAHVITDESGTSVADNIIVRLTDASEHTANVIAYDSDSDIAILKIEADGLTPAQCGDSDKLAVGEELVVVGNPLGELGGSVTNGIVSATEREIQMGGVTMHLIQTNAAVNPGNSGGGMFNMKGQLVGIINAKSSGSGIEGLGFAIPINQALEVSEQLLEYGYVRGKTMIGVTFQDVSGSNYYYYYNIKAGVYVAELTKGYNDNNLKVGDRVIAVNGEEVTTSEDIKAVVTSSSVGDVLKFQLYRDNKLMEVEVTCYERVPDTQTNIQFDQETDTQNGKNTPETLPEDDLDVFYSPFGGGLEEFFFGGGQ